MIIPGGEDDDDLDLRTTYEALSGQVLGFAVNALGDRSAAEDCVQETFLRVWRSRDRYRGALGSERTWVFAIARNVVTDVIRHRARRPRLVAEPDQERVDPTELAPAVEERLVLLQALAQLSPEHRQVVAAVQLDGLTYQQLSEDTGVPVATLRTRMYYALRSLRGLLGEGGERV